jgi:hypothetical protein
MSKLVHNNDIPIANAFVMNDIQLATIEPVNTISTPSIHSHESSEHLVNFPKGLKEIIRQSAEECDTRYWVVDNSTSMTNLDGKSILYKNGLYTHRTVSRFEELCETLLWHGQMATELNACTEFHLLNKPFNFPSKKVVVTGSSGLSELKTLCKTAPSGSTPLCATIREIIADIRKKSAILRAENKKVSVVIATDGESSDGDITPVLKELTELPCMCVIIRLCTDDHRIHDYWNNIDRIVELDLDVLDDLSGECEQVTLKNPWLTYCEPLQRVREWGTSLKVFDFLDERRLSLSEIGQFVKYLTGNTDLLLDPYDNKEVFIDAIKHDIIDLLHVYNPDKKRLLSWIDFTMLDQKSQPQMHQSQLSNTNTSSSSICEHISIIFIGILFIWCII